MRLIGVGVARSIRSAISPWNRSHSRVAHPSRSLVSVRRATVPCSLLVFAVNRAGCCSRGRAGLRLTRVAHLPDRAAGVVGNEERTVLGDGERGGPSPHLGAPFARSPEAGHEILVVACRLPVLERHAHYLVAGRLGAVPRPLEGHEGAALHLDWKLLGIVEHDVERRGMRLEQEVGRDRCLDLSGCEIGEARLRMWPDIGVRPAVEAAFLYPDQVVGGQIVAEPVTLLYDGPELTRLR